MKIFIRHLAIEVLLKKFSIMKYNMKITVLVKNTYYLHNKNNFHTNIRLINFQKLIKINLLVVWKILNKSNLI